MVEALVSFDPGADGGVAILYDDGSHYVARVKHDPDKNSFCHAEQLCDLVFPKLEGKKLVAVVTEKAQASPQMGVSSAFKYGRTAGLIYGTLAAYYVTQGGAKPALAEISPSKWKPRMGLSTDKAASISLARQKFVTQPKLTHGMAEALLLASYYQTEQKLWSQLL